VGIGSFWPFKELQEPIFLSLFRGIFSHHPHPSLPRTLRRVCAHLCNVDGHLLPQPLSYREWARLCNVDRRLLSNPPPLLRKCARLCNVDRRLLSNPPPLLRKCARLCNVGQHLLTYPESGSSDGESTPPASRTVRPCVASRGLCSAWRLALRPRYNIYPSQPHSPLPPRLPYNI
jgi:hypothetical protein